ncbi:MAG: biotin--[acetyl-CoA-carboxylase] ligase [candidate division WOR-3 bacterium]
MRIILLPGVTRFNKILVYHTVSSTQDIAKSLVLAQRAQVSEVVISAYRQTQGHGRHYEYWVSEPGGLYFSVIYKSPVPIIHVDNFTKNIGLIIKRALESVISNCELEIRGINDLYLNEKKLAGILVETVSFASQLEPPPYVYIIGIGINVNQTQFPVLSKPATSLFNELKIKFSRYKILSAICRGLSEKFRNK